jgi:DNA repair exonuclease SbcCD ATPase subunit
MPASEADRFLEAEDQATRLVEELSQLKNEAASHASSSAALEATAASLEDLASRVEGLATQVGETVRAARELGIPGLLEQQESRVGQRIAETGSAVEKSVENKLHRDLGELAQRLEGQLGATEKRLNAQVGTIKKVVTTYGVAALVGLAVVAVLVLMF